MFSLCRWVFCGHAIGDSLRFVFAWKFLSYLWNDDTDTVYEWDLHDSDRRYRLQLLSSGEFL